MKSTGAIILAAGGASRFGKAKQLLEINGETLIDRACRVAMEVGCVPVLRVLGARAEEISEHSNPDGVSTIINKTWQDGMGATLAFAVSELELRAANCESVLILLCDQPSIDAAMLQELVQASHQPGISIVLADSGETTGPPA
ncbi:MAG: nucleotidyltransferase family protein, partial [Verrucomicrobiaceae bacterium]